MHGLNNPMILPLPWNMIILTSVTTLTPIFGTLCFYSIISLSTGSATLRYSHEDFEDIAGLLDLDYESDRITLAFLFSITNNLALNFEFTHTEIDVAGEDVDADEFYVEGLFTF